MELLNLVETKVVNALRATQLDVPGVLRLMTDDGVSLTTNTRNGNDAISAACVLGRVLKSVGFSKQEETFRKRKQVTRWSKGDVTVTVTNSMADCLGTGSIYIHVIGS